MFTPEFFRNEPAEYVLVANHYVETEAAIALSTAYNRARIAAGKQHVPNRAGKFIVIYDVRGQSVGDDLELRLEEDLGDLAEIRVRRT
jgi:hypothetical protein